MAPRIFTGMPGNRRHVTTSKKRVECSGCGKLVVFFKKKKLFSRNYIKICSECGRKIE